MYGRRPRRGKSRQHPSVWVGAAPSYGLTDRDGRGYEEIVVGERRKTTVEIDLQALREAARHLGTTGLKETLNAALHDVIRRAELERGARYLEQGLDHVPASAPRADRDAPS